MLAMAELSKILIAGACLIEPETSVPATDLKAVLTRRLAQYYLQLGQKRTPGKGSTLDEVELEIAQEALFVVAAVQDILKDESLGTRQPGALPAVGARGLAEIRTLISITFKWGVEKLMSRLVQSWTLKRPTKPAKTEVIDLTLTSEDHKLLSSLSQQLLGLLFPEGIQGPMMHTDITAVMLSRHITELLRPCLALGWLPKWLASETSLSSTTIRPLTMKLLANLPPSQTLAALGSVLSGSLPAPAHVKRICGVLLTKQLLRPGGVRGLCAAVFGEDQALGNDSSLERLEQVATILNTIPADMVPQVYFQIIIPRILELLSEDMPPAYKRAAAFAISRMLTKTDKNAKHSFASAALLSILHRPFIPITGGSTDVKLEGSVEPTPSVVDALPTSRILSSLVILVQNTDPSPDLISSLLSPILPALFSFFSHLESFKASDPTNKECLRGLLATWGRIIDEQEGVSTLWRIIEGEGGDWELDEDGQYRQTERRQAFSIPLAALQDIQTSRSTIDVSPQSTHLNLYPEPIHFVLLLELIGRSDMSSTLFLTLFKKYRESSLSQESKPIQTLLYVQIIIQMQERLSDKKSRHNILNEPQHILSFIGHVLESRVPTVETCEENSQEDDSDDESIDFEHMNTNVEMKETAINLLLSILEANPNLSTSITPILSEIYELIKPLADNSPETLRTLAREARMVLTARSASTSSPAMPPSHIGDKNDVMETYQRALKLLQDPVLPVRSYGLLLLRQVVSVRDVHGRVSLDLALVPAILSIFLQSIQDDDSYIFLNAVQGLAAMVDAYGKDVVKGLVEQYCDGLFGPSLSQQEVDIRLRVGEALGQVIRRCGQALGIYVNLLVPPLFRLVRTTSAPTVLRTSALSLLADCEVTEPLSLLPYNVDLFEAMIDLVQVESTTAAKEAKQPDGTNRARVRSADDEPTSQSSRLPPLRRAALHFVSSLCVTMARAHTALDERVILSGATLRRAKTTLSYVALTDEDAVVRVMAREAEDHIDQLIEVILTS